jgi:glutathione S-transferase
LKELKLSFSEEIIPLSPPKPKEYLFINPRGTVPTLKFNQEIITESAIVAQFLADAFPPALVPKNNGPQTALQRARVAFFVDTYMSKPQAQVMKAIFTSDKDVVRNSIDGAIRDFSEHIEPLLADANPFFAGSKDLTLVEVCAPKT